MEDPHDPNQYTNQWEMNIRKQSIDEDQADDADDEGYHDGNKLSDVISDSENAELLKRWRHGSVKLIDKPSTQRKRRLGTRRRLSQLGAQTKSSKCWSFSCGRRSSNVWRHCTGKIKSNVIRRTSEWWNMNSL